MIILIAISVFFILSEFDDEIDDALLFFGYVWIYLCKLPSCPDYGKFWSLCCNFLLHLQEREAYIITIAIFAARRAIEIEWRYIIDLYLLSRAVSDFRSREDSEE